MSNSLPPIILMQTIEAVTRLGSLKRAAEEMNVTPSAISHRIRLVEERFGQRLFEREGQGVRSTDNARELAAAVASAIAAIDERWRTLGSRAETRQVRLCVMAAFAELFILSNDEEFRRRFPDFHVDSTSLTVSEGGMRGDFDILIGIGPYPGEGWDYEDLMPLMVRPIYSPRADKPIVADKTVLGPILRSTTDFMSWDAVAAELGFSIAPGVRQIGFDSLLTACHAAGQGKGITLAPAGIAERMIRAGEVVAFGEGVARSPLSYWIAVRRARRLDSVYGRFRRWINAAIRASG